jgi:hypothetical protein
MLKYLVLGFGLIAVPALAQDTLKFDSARLCAWQSANNGMDAAECSKLEDEGKAIVAELENSVDADRKTACIAEGNSFAGDSGFSSYALYASCLKDGPGSL